MSSAEWRKSEARCAELLPFRLERSVRVAPPACLDCGVLGCSGFRSGLGASWNPPPQSRHRGRSAAWTWRKMCCAFWPSPRRDGWSIVAFGSLLVVSAPLAESNTCSWFDIDMKMTTWGLTRSTSGIKWLSIHRCLTTWLGKCLGSWGIARCS